MNINKYTEVAILAAKEAGHIHKKYFRKDFKVKTKKTSFDLVTIVDVESERKVVSTIKRYFPNHNFLAEENTYKKTDCEYSWIIDPLDGTNNFTFGLPIFCVSIACLRGNEIISGALFDVISGELFVSQKNMGAYLNGKRIYVNNTDKLNNSLLITGFYYDRGRPMVRNLQAMKRFFLKRIVGLRRLGSAALDLCYVACGRASGFWEFELNPWDFAAGKLLIEEARGRVSDQQGKPLLPKKSFVVASNGKIHNKMLKVINSK